MIPLVLGIGAAYGLVGGLGTFAGLKKIDQWQTQENLFTAEAQAKILERYRSELGIGEGFDYSAGAFDKYEKDRAKSVTDLNTLFKNKEVQEAFKDKDIAAAVKKALQPNPGKPATPPNPNTGSLKAAQVEYEENAKAFGQLIKKSIPPFKVEQVIQTMKELADDGVAAIRAQHAYEKANLTAKLDDPDFQKQLTDAGVTDLEEAKQSMLDDLDKNHKAQEKAFTDSTAASLRQLHKASATEMDRVIFLATLSENNAKMKEMIKDIAAAKNEQNGIPPGTLVASQGTSPTDPNVGVVQISDLKTIHTNTGKTITQNDDGVFTLDFGRPLFNPSYYFMGDKVESDMTLLARAIKASGKTGIEMDVDFDNEEVAAERAKQAYKACIEAGFPPEKIKINVNGAAKTAEDIFGKGSSEIAQTKQRAQEIAGEHDKLAIKPEGHNTTEVKAKMQELRAEAAEEARVAAEKAAQQKAGVTIEEADDEEEEATPTISHG